MFVLLLRTYRAFLRQGLSVDVFAILFFFVRTRTATGMLRPLFREVCFLLSFLMDIFNCI